MVIRLNIRSSSLPRPTLQHDFEYFLSPLKYILQLCLAKFSVSATFFGGRDGTDGTDKQTDRQTDIRTDRLFSENIILDESYFLRIFHFKKSFFLKKKKKLG